MKRTITRSPGVAMAVSVLSLMLVAAAVAGHAVSPVFGVAIPAGYRDWAVISVAHEAGKNNDIRVIVGNDIAIKAFRDGLRPFPDGAIIGRLAWDYVPSAENNAIFGQAQSFVAGPATNIQFSVKGREKISRHQRLGLRSVRERRAEQERGIDENLLALPCPREQGGRFRLHALLTLKARRQVVPSRVPSV